MTPRQDSLVHRVWRAMNKFSTDASLTEAEWDALSELTLMDRSTLSFERGNVRWATTDEERADNRRFYQSLGHPPDPALH
jgi:hypothetical protein